MADDAADEAATRYDRQVRLWGASTQQKLQNTSVALHATGGVAVETAKNLCLAGIGAMRVVDTAGVVCEDDLAVTHLLHHSEVGQPRGPILAARLRDMNPLVETTAATIDTLLTAASAAAAFSVTVVTPSSSAMLQEVLRARMAAIPAGGGGGTPSGLVVSLVQVGPFTFGLLVPLGGSNAAGAATGETLMQAVLGEDGGSLRGKPKALQLAVLALRCGGGGSTAAMPFPALLQRLLSLRAALSAESVDDDGIQLLLDTLCGAPDPLREKPSAVDATIGGGVCAQRIINMVSEGGASGVQWFALETRGRIECVVGP